MPIWERLAAPDIGCHNCIGACCGPNMVHQLTPAEQSFIVEGGTELDLIVSAEEAQEAASYRGNDRTLKERARQAGELPAGHSAFVTKTACGYLEIDPETGQGSCSAYEDPLRPKSCADFPEDSPMCNAIRRDHGLPARRVLRHIQISGS